MSNIHERENFEGDTFIKSSFKNATMKFSDVSGMKLRSVDTNGLDIDDHDLFFGEVFVNGVNVVPLVDAELNRLFPGRELQHAQTLEGLREGWEAVQAAWDETVRSTPAEQRDVRVDDEWCLSETLRHLILATDAWLLKGIQRETRPFHEIGLIFTGADKMGFDMSIFRDEPPAWEEILEIRSERQNLVTIFLNEVTEDQLSEKRDNPWGGDDFQPTVGDCIRVILEEEWAHLRYVRRDLAKLNSAKLDG